MTETLTIDDLQFELRRSSRRQTVGVTVDRGGELILHAPDDCAIETIEQVARDKRFWVYTKLAIKEMLAAPTKPREYVAGEGFHYLGRSYRLRLVEADQQQPLRLYQGRFELRRSDADRGRQHFIRWYRDHARDWLGGRLPRWEERIGAHPSDLTVRSLGNRWGSCSPDGRLNIHWRTILLPPSIIDYVLVHELVHLVEPTHSPAFWDRLARSMPDYESLKTWLAQNGSLFDL